VSSWASPQRQERGFSNSEYHQQAPVSQIPILHMEVKSDGADGYQYAYETGNKIAIQEAGTKHNFQLATIIQKNISGDSTKRQGSYSYVAPDGQQVSMSYVADEGGFRPQGSHMPVAPPIPEEIRKAVEQNLADEARGIVDDGQYREGGEEGGDLPAPRLPSKFRV